MISIQRRGATIPNSDRYGPTTCTADQLDSAE
jgi:hypothetical protein